MNTGKSWESPQLIVLQRGAPEESVLQACKTIMLAGGPLVGASACGLSRVPKGGREMNAPCGPCSTEASS